MKVGRPLRRPYFGDCRPETVALARQMAAQSHMSLCNSPRLWPKAGYLTAMGNPSATCQSRRCLSSKARLDGQLRQGRLVARVTVPKWALRYQNNGLRIEVFSAATLAFSSRLMRATPAL